MFQADRCSPQDRFSYFDKCPQSFCFSLCVYFLHFFHFDLLQKHHNFLHKNEVQLHRSSHNFLLKWQFFFLYNNPNKYFALPYLHQYVHYDSNQNSDHYVWDCRNHAYHFDHCVLSLSFFPPSL